jgi:hypothetical protein
MTQSKNHILIVAEKPSEAFHIQKAWNRMYPEDTLVFFYTNFRGNFTFEVEENFTLYNPSFCEYPKLEETIHIQVPNNIITSTQSFEEEVKKADKLVCATIATPEGARNFLNLVNHTNMEIDLSTVQWLKISDFVEENLITTIFTPTFCSDKEFLSMSKIGFGKQYLNYNYKKNLEPIFNELFSLFTGHSPKVPLSKYTLQLLLYVSKHKDTFTRTDLKHILSQETQNITAPFSAAGSILTQCEIVENFKHLKLLKQKRRTRQGETVYCLNTFAQKLIDHTSPDLYDPHLSDKIEEWCNNWPNSQQNIDTYIKEKAASQKEYMKQKPSTQHLFSKIRTLLEQITVIDT